MKKKIQPNTLTLQPGDQIRFIGGLKISNEGDQVLIIDLPTSYKMKPPNRFEILKISIEK